jgi:monofunctional biosynthetic peptidoglycan transglycosylase
MTDGNMARSFRFGSILSNRIVRRAALVLLALLLLPYLLTVLYLVVTPPSTLMLWRWVTGQRVERTVVPLEAIALTLPRAVIGAEDARYCSHWGVDFRELREAIADADDLSEARGGSTVAQQAAKNLFLWHGRSYVRKALELPLALWLDLVLGKRRLMEIYLNVVEWGPNGEFGAEAAARRAFGKPARSLTVRESALLAASLPNPVTRDARRPGAGLNRLAGTYVARAQQAQDGCVVGAARR